MSSTEEFPHFDQHFSHLNEFVLKLVEAYEAGAIRSWDDLQEKVNAYFTPERMVELETLVPGWQKMASYSGRITLVHVMCVFLGLFMLPEFQNLSQEQQQILKWIVVFHDVEKEITIGAGEDDKTHAFRAAGLAARELPRLGFAVTPGYASLVTTWSEMTRSASKVSADHGQTIQDNEKLPEILTGIQGMFGRDTPAALIIKGVLLHMSITVVHGWPQAAPLTGQEIRHFIDPGLLPLLKVMMLADNEGWSLFDPDNRAEQRKDTLQVFQRIEETISA